MSLTTKYAITPYLACRNATAALEFYKKAFGAEETFRLQSPDGKIAHAQMKIGDARFMLADEIPNFHRSPLDLGGAGVVLHLDVPDVDAFAARAVEAGAQIVLPIADQFYGARAGRLQDPYGHVWLISSHIKSVSADEMQKKFNEMCAKK